MLELYRAPYRGWNVKHFHEHLVRDHGFRWGYTWVKTQLQTAGLVARAARRGAHRRKRERKPFEGMMLHQDGSRAEWLCGQAGLDLIVTMDDATSTIYSAFLVEEEGTASTFRGCWRCSRRTVCRRASIPIAAAIISTRPKPAAVDKEAPTQVGRALKHLGIEHIPAYSPEARGRSERMFGTLQDRLPRNSRSGRHHRHRGGQSLHQATSICLRTMPVSPGPPRRESALRHAADPALLAETLCIEEERVVAPRQHRRLRDRRLQLPQSPARAHYVKARCKVRQYPGWHARGVPRTATHRTLHRQGPEIARGPTCPQR